MTKGIIAFDKDTSLVDITKSMKEQDIGMVLICENTKLLGILTDRDIVTKILANDDNEIKEYYTSCIVTVDMNDDISSALEKMTKHKIKRLIVTDKDKAVGVVSLSNIIQHYKDIEVLETIQNIFEINRNTDEYRTKVNEFEL